MSWHYNLLRKKMIIPCGFYRLAVATGILLTLSLSEPGQALAETYRVYGIRSSDVLNIRSHPSPQARRTGSIPPNGYGIIKLGYCASGWCPVQYRNMTGWVSRRYLVRQAPANTPHRVTGIANWDVLYIRARPSVRGRKTGSIPPYGRGVRKLGPCRGNWCKINYRGMIGWASMMYLIPDTSAVMDVPPPTPRPPATPDIYQPNRPQPITPPVSTPPSSDMFEGLEDPQ